MNLKSTCINAMVLVPTRFSVTMVLLLCVAAPHQVEGASGKSHLKLLKDLLENYTEPFMRPVNKTTDPVLVGLRYAPILATLDETNEELLVRGMLVLKWNDYRLQWQPSDYEDIIETEIPLSFNDEQKVWIPEVSLYECLVTDFHSFYPETNSVTLSYKGEIHWYTLATTKSYCPMDSTEFPLDVQHCNLTFTTWLYDRNKQEFYIIADLLENNTFEKYELQNILWSVKIANVYNNITTYECGTCKGKEQSYIQYTLELTRGNSDWLFETFVYPCVVISVLMMLVPCLPQGGDVNVDAPSYALTGLLTFFVFLTSFNSRMPATKASYLGSFIMCGIIGGILAVMCAVFKPYPHTDNKHRVTGRRNYRSINDRSTSASDREFEQGRSGTIEELEMEGRSNENNHDNQSQNDRLLQADGETTSRSTILFAWIVCLWNFYCRYIAWLLIVYHAYIVIVIWRWKGSSG